MHRETIDVGLLVSDFLEEAEGDPAFAFELASQAQEDAIEMAASDIRDALGDRADEVTVGRTAFAEFDSANASHASAHWDVEVTSADPELLATLSRALGGEEAPGAPAP